MGWGGVRWVEEMLAEEMMLERMLVEIRVEGMLDLPGHLQEQ